MSMALREDALACTGDSEDNGNIWKQMDLSLGEQAGRDLWALTDWHYFRYSLLVNGHFSAT